MTKHRTPHPLLVAGALASIGVPGCSPQTSQSQQQTLSQHDTTLYLFSEIETGTNPDGTLRTADDWGNYFSQDPAGRSYVPCFNTAVSDADTDPLDGVRRVGISASSPDSRFFNVTALDVAVWHCKTPDCATELYSSNFQGDNFKAVPTPQTFNLLDQRIRNMRADHVSLKELKPWLGLGSNLETHFPERARAAKEWERTEEGWDWRKDQETSHAATKQNIR